MALPGNSPHTLLISTRKLYSTLPHSCQMPPAKTFHIRNGSSVSSAILENKRGEETEKKSCATQVVCPKRINLHTGSDYVIIAWSEHEVSEYNPAEMSTSPVALHIVIHPLPSG